MNLLSETLIERGDTRDYPHIFGFASTDPKVDAEKLAAELHDAQIGYTERRVTVRVLSHRRTDWVRARRLIGFIFKREVEREESRCHDDVDDVLARVEQAWRRAGVPTPDRVDHGVA